VEVEQFISDMTYKHNALIFLGKVVCLYHLYDCSRSNVDVHPDPLTTQQCRSHKFIYFLTRSHKFMCDPLLKYGVHLDFTE